MTSIGRRGRAGLFAVSVIATASSTSAAPLGADQAGMATIPLFARFATDGSTLRGYSAPVYISGSLRKFFISIPFKRQGEVTFARPDSLDFTIQSVPKQYDALLAQLGTPRTWPYLYTFSCVKTTSTDGTTAFELRGTPKDTTNDIDHVVIRMPDGDGPIDARWTLKDGWVVTSTIHMQSAGAYLVPKEEDADIVGHGLRIRTDLTYGTYQVAS
jgi:hypothetical protein